jgi:hypothetical protein
MDYLDSKDFSDLCKGNPVAWFGVGEVNERAYPSKSEPSFW